MRIHHRIRCRPSWRVSSVKARGAREGREERGKGGKGEGRTGGGEMVDKKMLRGETKVTLN